MRIVLVCDQKWRDLPSLVVIKRYLNSYGHKAIVVSTKEFESLLPLFQPDAVVLNHFWDRRYQGLALKLREAGIAVAVLPTEGSTTIDLWGPILFGEYSDFSLIDLLLCWNHTWAEEIARHGALPKEKLEVVGCPRFDFSVMPLMQACMGRSEFREKLGLIEDKPIIAFASRFSNAKLAYASPEALADFLAQCREVGVYQCLEQAGYKLESLLPFYKSLLDQFIDLCAMAARARPNLQFIFKPHPNEDVNYIRNRLGEVAGGAVKLAVGVYIGDVLRSADVLVNADCTTSIEAWLHGTPVVDVQISKDDVTGRPDISAGNWIAHDQEELLSLIDKGLVDRSVQPDLKLARDAFIKKWFDIIDGKRCEVAARALDRFVRSWGSKRKIYPVSNAGGLNHVAKQTLKWLAGVPGGVSVRAALQPSRRSQAANAIYDKVITKRDVEAMTKRIAPLLAPNRTNPSSPA